MQDGSAQFEKRAGSLKNKFFMENLKSMIMMAVVGLILLGLVYFMVRWTTVSDHKLYKSSD